MKKYKFPESQQLHANATSKLQNFKLIFMKHFVVLVWVLVLCCVLVNKDGQALAMEDEIEELAVAHDYRDALGKAILFFEGQRSGKLAPGLRVNWRGDSALSDGKPQNV